MRRGGTMPAGLVQAGLACGFAGSVLMVLLLGAGVYRSATASSDAAHSERICTAYIAEQLRHSDEVDAVSLEQFDGGEALFLESGEDPGYVTIIYSHDGWLWELFCQRESGFSREDGVKIVRAGEVLVTEEGRGIFSIRATGTDGAVSRRMVVLRSGG